MIDALEHNKDTSPFFADPIKRTQNKQNMSQKVVKPMIMQNSTNNGSRGSITKNRFVGSNDKTRSPESNKKKGVHKKMDARSHGAKTETPKPPKIKETRVEEEVKVDIKDKIVSDSDSPKTDKKDASKQAPSQDHKMVSIKKEEKPIDPPKVEKAKEPELPKKEPEKKQEKPGKLIIIG